MDLAALTDRIDNNEPIVPGMVRSAARKLDRSGRTEDAQRLIDAIATDTVAQVAAEIADT